MLSKNNCKFFSINLPPATLASNTWPTAEGGQEYEEQIFDAIDLHHLVH